MSQSDVSIFDGNVNTHERVFKERRATWLELFFDLAYVAVIAQLTYLVGSRHTLWELAGLVLLFIAIFWSWWVSTANRNVSEEEDVVTILGYQVQMFFALTMSMFLATVFEHGANGFLLGLIGVRVTQAVLLERYYRKNPERAPKTRNLQHGMLISIALWSASILVPPPLRFLLWTLLVVFDLLVPQTKGKGNTTTLLNPHHLQERIGLFLLLIMGESVIVVAISSGLSGIVHSAQGGLIGLAGMLIMIGLWWLYYPYIDEVARGKRTKSLQLFLYSHILLFLGVILLAVGVKEFVNDVKYDELEHVNNFITSSLALIVVSFASIKRSMGHFGRDCLYIALTSLSVLAGLYVIAQSLVTSATTEFLILAILFCGYVWVEYKHTHEYHKAR